MFNFKIQENKKTYKYEVSISDKDEIFQFKLNDAEIFKYIYSKVMPFGIMMGFDNNFQILEEIGKGCSGTVKRVKNLIDSQFYAAKIISKHSFITSCDRLVNKLIPSFLVG